MFKRIRWFALGALSAMWVERRLRQKARELAPESLGGRVLAAAQERGRSVQAAVLEGRQAMRHREAELRAELRRGVALGGAEVRALRPVTTPAPGAATTA